MTGKYKISFLLAAILVLFCTLQAQRQEQPNSTIIDAAQLLRDLETLSADNMQGRLAGTPGSLKAREYVLQRFKNSGLKTFGASFLQTFEFTASGNKKIEGANVVGYIKGKQTPDKYIVVTAHYDHVGVANSSGCTGASGDVCNGADDNASGVAALFAFASYFNKNQPANSIIFVAFDAEELGLRGSRKFVESPPVNKAAMALNVNLDMISRSDKNELYAAGAFHYPFLKPQLEKIARAAKIKLLLGHDRPELEADDWTNQSDHYPFHQAKIPFVYFGVENHKDYHQPSDEFKNINRKFYVQAVETVLAALKTFDANLAQIETQRR